MKALSLHQPPASLCVTRQPCDCDVMNAERPLHQTHCASLSMVKALETRSWPCPPNLIGSRIAIHATKCNLTGAGLWLGEALDPDVARALPLGAVVGSAVIEACYPIVDFGEWPCDPIPVIWRARPDALYLGAGHYFDTDISDQIPYGDYRPGRYAWLLGDAAPVQERCPWCWGTGWRVPSRDEDPSPVVETTCPVCDGAGRCEPISARGRQRIWEWQP